MRLFTDKQRLLEPALLLLLSPLYYLVPWGHLPGPAGVWGVPFLVLYGLWLPGSSLRQSLRWAAPDPIARNSLNLFLGLFYFLLLAFIYALSGIHLQWFIRLLPAVLLPATILPVIINRPPGRTIPDVHTKTSLSAGLVLLAMVVAAVLAGGLPVDFMKDTLDHAGYVNEIQSTGQAFPTSTLYLDAGEDGEDIRKGLLHVLYGFSSRLMATDGLTTLTAWNPVMAGLMILAIYTTALLLFGHRWIAVLSVAFYLLGTAGGLGDTLLRILYYPNRFGLGFFVLMLAPLLGYLKNGRRRDLIVIACLSFGAAGTHIMYTVLSSLAVAIILVWKICFPESSISRHLRRTITAGLVMAAGFLPYVLFRYLGAYHETNELHSGIQGVVYVFDGWFIADPWKVLGMLGPVGLFGFLAAFILWKDRRQQAGLGYLIAAGFSIPLLLFNPLLLPPMFKALTYLVTRIPFIFPFYMLTACFTVRFLSPELGGWPNRLRSPAGKLLFILLAVIFVFQSGRHYREVFMNRTGPEQARSQSYLLWEDGLDFLGQLPAGQVVAGDPLTLYSVPALTEHYVMCTLDQHVPPGDRLLPQRLQACRDILSPFVSMTGTTRLMEQWGAGLVVVNSRIGPDRPLAFWEMGPDVTLRIRSKFLVRPDLFEVLYDEDGFLVCRWNGLHPQVRQTEFGILEAPAGEMPLDEHGTRPVPPAGETPLDAREPRPSEQSGGIEVLPDNPWFLSEIPDSMAAFGQPAGLAELAAFRFEKPASISGRVVVLDLLWQGRGKYPFKNYVVNVRFDHRHPELPLGGRPFPKLARKIKERTTDRRYRFRHDHKIENGFLNPDTWPPGAYVLDRTTIRLPEKLLPGEYSVFVKLNSVPYARTYYLRDLFYDDDIYQGVLIGTIMVP